MVYWSELYKEIGQKIIDTLPEVKHVDLWHEQINYLTEELPFSTPAVFIEFNTLDATDIGEKVQHLTTQVDLHIFYETFSDTYMSAGMQEDALSYLELISKLNALFHGHSGVNYGTMSKTDMKREDTGGAGNLYRLSFVCEVHDYSAQMLYNEEQMNGRLDITNEAAPVIETSTAPFDVQLN